MAAAARDLRTAATNVYQTDLAYRHDPSHAQYHNNFVLLEPELAVVAMPCGGPGA